MKNRYPAALLLATFLGTTTAGTEQAQSVGLRPTLAVTMQDSRYCSENPGRPDVGLTTDTLEFSLTVTFQNRGSHPIILYRQAMRVLSVSVTGAGRQPLEIPIGHALVFPSYVSQDPTGGALRPTSDFVTVPAGSEWTLPSKVDAHIPLDSMLVPPGKYSVSAELQPWDRELEVGQQLRSRWRQHGLFWFESVQSVPFVVEILPKPLRREIRCRPR